MKFKCRKGDEDFHRFVGEFSYLVDSGEVVNDTILCSKYQYDLALRALGGEYNGRRYFDGYLIVLKDE
jgi:hypothetical protein